MRQVTLPALISKSGSEEDVLADDYRQSDSNKWFQVLLCIANNSTKYLSFVYTRLNDQTSISSNLSFANVIYLPQFKYQIVLLDP